MPTLLGISYQPEHKARAGELFEKACRLVRTICPESVAHVCRGEAATMGVFGEGNLASGFRESENRCLAYVGVWYARCAEEGGSEPERRLQYVDELCSKDDLGVFDQLQGQFAFARLEKRSGDLTLWSDRLGIHPLYSCIVDGIPIVGTSALVLASLSGAGLNLHSAYCLVSGTVPFAPYSLFERVRRLSWGEIAVLKQGRHEIRQTWSPYRAAESYARLGEAAARGAAVLKRISAQITRMAPRIISDLTSGLDSRLIVAGLSSVEGSRFAIHVSGSEDFDTRIARIAANKFGWELHHHTPPPDWGKTRFEFFEKGVLYSDGEFSGGDCDGMLRQRRVLSEDFDLVLGGGGGELLRDFFWTQEFFHAGKTSRVHVERLLKARFYLTNVDFVFRAHRFRDCRADIRRRIEEICNLDRGARNTQKLDAVLLWRYGGKFSSVRLNNWLCPTAAPCFSHEVAEWSFGVPWQFRRHGRLVRHVITALDPALSRLPTWYGGNANPLGWRQPWGTLRFAANHCLRGARRLRVPILGRLYRSPCRGTDSRQADRDFVLVLHEQFGSQPEHFCSADLYHPMELKKLLDDAREPGFNKFGLLYRIASLELICRFLQTHGAPHGLSG